MPVYQYPELFRVLIRSIMPGRGMSRPGIRFKQVLI
jgi:hypothetical protein